MNSHRHDPNDATVVSSFYSTPDGSNTVRFYEISNNNQKLHKSSLDELRIENYPSSALLNFKSFFTGKKASVNNGGPLDKSLNNATDVQEGSNAAKSISHHTRHDGGLLTVTAFDLTKKKGSDLALQDFLRRQAVLKQEAERIRAESRKRDLTQTWLETTSYSRGSRRRGSLDKKRNRSIDYGKNRKQYEAKYTNGANDFYEEDEYDESYMGSPRGPRRGTMPLPLPCNCLECQANMRSGGMPTYDCNCMDCIMQRKRMPYYPNNQKSTYH